MPIVKFTYALKRFYPDLKDCQIDHCTNLTDLLNEVENQYPGIKNYILDENNALRKHVNIFIDDQLIWDKVKLSDSFQPNSEIFIMQALSGG